MPLCVHPHTLSRSPTAPRPHHTRPHTITTTHMHTTLFIASLHHAAPLEVRVFILRLSGRPHSRSAPSALRLQTLSVPLCSQHSPPHETRTPRHTCWSTLGGMSNSAPRTPASVRARGQATMRAGTALRVQPRSSQHTIDPPLPLHHATRPAVRGDADEHTTARPARRAHGHPERRDRGRRHSGDTNC